MLKTELCVWPIQKVRSPTDCREEGSLLEYDGSQRKKSLLEYDGSQNCQIHKQKVVLPSPAEDSAKLLKAEPFVWQKV